MKRIIKSISQITLTMTLAVTGLTVSATMYKWVDENGNTIYSENRPGGNYEVEIVQPPAKVDSAKALKDLRDSKNRANKMSSERDGRQQEKETAAQEVATQKKNCDIAHAKVASLQQPRAKISQPDGSRIRLDEEERQRQIVQANAKVQEWCD
jgi:hypothetical protein